jgi:hypothetical protein
MSVKATTSFELQRLQLTSLASGTTIDIRYVTIEFNLYEDLFSNVLTGDLTLSDANNLISNVPIFGYEILEVSFKSTMDESFFTKTFRITNVRDVTPANNERSLIYVLSFSSEQDLINESVSVSRAYRKTLISDMVADITSNYLKIPSLTTLETTKYTHDYVLPFLDPLTCINFLASRANSASFRGALYLFYENRDGFHFRSLESAAAQEPVTTFHLSPANIRDNPAHELDDATDIRGIQDYSFVTLPDILDNTHTGMYGARLMVHSLVQKIYRIHDFDYLERFPEYRHVESNNRTMSLQLSTLENSNTSTRLGGAGLTSPESLLRLMPFDEEKVQVTTPLEYTGGKKLEEKPFPALPTYEETAKLQFPSDSGTTPRPPKSIRNTRITIKNTPIESPEPPVLSDVDTTNITTVSTKSAEKGYTFVSRQKVERWLLPRDSQRQAMFENIRLSLTVPGTTDVTIGDIVDIQLPSPEPVTRDNPQKMDLYYSGRYLVTNVRHRIQQADNAYYTYLECVKDSVHTAYPI